MLGRTNAVIGGTKQLPTYDQLINYKILYNQGNEYTAITGGWDSWWDESEQYSNLTKNTTNITMTETITATNSAYAMEFGTKQAVNVSTFNLLQIILKDMQIPTGLVTLAGTNYRSRIITELCSEKVTSFYGIYAEPTNAPTSRIRANIYVKEAKSNFSLLDISDLSSAWVGISCGQASTGTTKVSMTGCAMYKKDDYNTWISKANIVGLNTLDAVLDNSEAMNALMANEDAVNFMVKQCTGTVMAKFIQSTTSMRALNSSPYKTVVQSNEHWAKFLSMVA